MSPLEPPTGALVDNVLAPTELLPTTLPLIVVPVIVPPVIATAVAFCVDIVPNVPTLACTKAVVAILVELSLDDGVGATAVPTSVVVPVTDKFPPTTTLSPLEPFSKFFKTDIKLRIALFKLAGEQPSAILILVISVLSAAVALNSEILVFAMFYPCLSHISDDGEIVVHVSELADDGVHVSEDGVTGVHPSPCIIPFAVTVAIGVIDALAPVIIPPKQ